MRKKNTNDKKVNIKHLKIVLSGGNGNVVHKLKESSLHQLVWKQLKCQATLLSSGGKGNLA